MDNLDLPRQQILKLIMYTCGQIAVIDWQAVQGVPNDTSTPTTHDRTRG